MGKRENVFETDRNACARLVTPGGWKWMQEYALFSATYVISCPPDRECEYGSGVYYNGEPRGARGRFRGAQQIQVFGAGAIHVRVVDDKGPCFVGLAQKGSALFGVYSNPGAAEMWSFIKASYDQWRKNNPGLVD